MKHTNTFAAIVGIAFSTPSFADESFLCVADHATGFAFENDQWSPSTFKADQKYVVTRNKNSGVAWEVKQLGSSFPLSTCEDGFLRSIILNCTGIFEFRMHKLNGRFIVSSTLGYWNDDLNAKP